MQSWGVVVFLVAFAGIQVFADDLAFPENAKSLTAARIVSGWEAAEGQIPWQLSLRMVNPTGAVSSCGGSIIHPEWGLTAAHCTATRVTMVLRAGAVSLWRPELIFETYEYFNHPQYIDALQSIVQPHDIAILKFQRSITFSHRVQPIRVQNSLDKNRNYEGVRLEASGWGRTWTNGATPENLQWVYLTGDSNQRCWSAFGGSSIIVDSTICASAYNVTSQSTCQGDSGGPLVELEADGQYTLVGVTSFVSALGCHADMPAGFIRPGHYHDWITAVTGINFDWVPKPPTDSSESKSSESISSESKSSESSSSEASESKSSESNSSESSESKSSKSSSSESSEEKSESKESSESKETSEAESEETTEAESKETSEAASEETVETESKETDEAESEETTEAESKETSEAASEETVETESKETNETESEETTEAESKETSEAASEETVEKESKETDETESEETTEAESKETSEAASEETVETESKETDETESEETTEAESKETSEAASKETVETESKETDERESEETTEAESKETSEAASEETVETESKETSEETTEAESKETSEAASEETVETVEAESNETDEAESNETESEETNEETSEEEASRLFWSVFRGASLGRVFGK